MGDETVFEIGERVHVTNVSPEIAGSVRAIWVDHMGAQFQVQYVDSTGRIQRDWFASTELRATDPQPVTE